MSETENLPSIYESNKAEAIAAGATKLASTVAKYTEVTNDESLSKATEILAQAKGFKRDIDKERTELTKDALTRKQIIDREAKVIKDRLDVVIRHFDQISKAYIMTQQARERIAHEVEQKRLAEELEAENAPKIEALQEELKVAKLRLQKVKVEDTDAVLEIGTEIGRIVAGIRELGGQAEGVKQETYKAPVVEGSLGSKTGMRDHWVYKVVDIDKIPREYMRTDPAAIKDGIDAGLRGDDIPGIKIYNDPILTSRRG